MRRALLLLAAMAALVVACLGVALAQTPSGTLDANTLPAPQEDSGGLGFDAVWDLGQTFTALNSGEVTSVQMHLQRYGEGPGELIVDLTTVDSSGKPATTLASTTVPASEVSENGYSLVTANFADPASIEAGQQYGLVISSASGCCYAWAYSQPVGEYSGGVLYYNSGGGWQPWSSYGTGVTDGVFAVYLNGSQTPAYDFGGFYSPVDNLPTFNKAKAGSAIPVKFSLGGDRGLDVFAKDATGNATSPTSGALACDSTAELDPIETTVSAGSSGLSYDAASDRYTYVWRTQKGWTGCRQLVVKFDDGTVERANFKFVK